MINKYEDRNTERTVYFDGQQLDSNDLNSAHDFKCEMRWLHNRYLHNWGIAHGYGVRGVSGDRVVRIMPGYAIDCLGREIVLTSEKEIEIPALSKGQNSEFAEYNLVARYAENHELVSRLESGTCKKSGAVRIQEAPVIYWRDEFESSTITPGIEIILCTIKVKNCRLAEPVSEAKRRSALPTNQPYIAAGRTEPGATEWQAWYENGVFIGLKTQVNTSGAGFNSTPRYQAQIIGQRQFKITLAGEELLLYYDGLVQVVTFKSNEFELQVLIPNGCLGEDSKYKFNSPPETIKLDLSELLELFKYGDKSLPKSQSGWHVVWIGIEE